MLPLFVKNAIGKTMTKLEKFFNIARDMAKTGDTIRKYRLGAVGVRADGAIVTSRNISTRKPEPHAHAESRLVRKLDMGAIVYVVRVLSDGSFTTARPCARCRKAMKARGVRRCYYSVNNNEYGVIKF